MTVDRRAEQGVFVGQDLEILVLVIQPERVLIRLSFPLLPMPFSVEFWTGEGMEFKIGVGIVGVISSLHLSHVALSVRADRQVLVDRLEVRAARLAGTAHRPVSALSVPARRRRRVRVVTTTASAHA